MQAIGFGVPGGRALVAIGLAAYIGEIGEEGSRDAWVPHTGSDGGVK